MIVNIVMMIMRLLGGMMNIKNGRLKKQNKRGTPTHYLASIKMVGLVYVRKRKK